MSSNSVRTEWQGVRTESLRVVGRQGQDAATCLQNGGQLIKRAIRKPESHGQKLAFSYLTTARTSAEVFGA